jgi:hypothetical protein
MGRITACRGERPDEETWQLFVYDEENCEVLYVALRISCEAAKNAAVEFAVAHLYTTDHDLKPEVMSQMLVWELVPGELLNWAKIKCFSGFDRMPGCAMSSSLSFI